MLIHDAGRVGEKSIFRFQRNRRGGGDFFQRQVKISPLGE